MNNNIISLAAYKAKKNFQPNRQNYTGNISWKEIFFKNNLNSEKLQKERSLANKKTLRKYNLK